MPPMAPYMSKGITGGSNLAKYSRMIRSPTWNEIFFRSDAELTSLNELRGQIWAMRAEYWIRKFKTAGLVKRGASVEWQYIKKRLAAPSTWTGTEMLAAGFFGVNVFGAFCVGEILSRRKLIGYGLVDPDWFPSHQQFFDGMYSPIFPIEDQGTSVKRYFNMTDRIIFTFFPSTYKLLGGGAEAYDRSLTGL